MSEREKHLIMIENISELFDDTQDVRSLSGTVLMSMVFLGSNVGKFPSDIMSRLTTAYENAFKRTHQRR